MALGSKKDKALSKADIIAEAQKLDDRRQEQIARQSRIIGRLVTENQMMMGLLGELQPTDERAGEVLNEIQKLRDAQRKEDQKMEKKNG
jgi:hypothetical protein